MVVSIHFEEKIDGSGTSLIIFRHHFGKVNEQFAFMILFLNVQGISNCIKILLICIRPILPDFKQRISQKKKANTYKANRIMDL